MAIDVERIRSNTLLIWIVASLMLIVGELPSIAQKDPHLVKKQSFLAESGSPLKALEQNGSVLLLKNTSQKDIVKWEEVCLVRDGSDLNVVKIYKLGDTSIKAGSTRVDQWGIDATPLVGCRTFGGMIAISYVKFADQSIWRSRRVNEGESKLNSVNSPGRAG